MTAFDALILGVVEGLTEFLPISSTAHLVIASRLLSIPESDFLSSFIIAIQLGAIASVVLMFSRRILRDRAAMRRVAAAFIPTALIGFLAYQALKHYLIDSLPVIAGALILGGIVLILFEKKYGGREDALAPPLSEMPYRTAILIGCAQAVAIIPGVSRAGATILGGLALGIRRRDIVEFSFLLAIPTMVSATGYDLLKSGASFAKGDWALLGIGFVVSFFAAAAAVSFLVRYIETHSFASFGYYRIALGLAILAVLAL